MTTQDLVLDSLKAQDIEDWKEHVAWEELLEPQLRSTREALTRQLVELSLGKKIEGTTLEQTAGKIYGLDFLFKELEKLLGRGRAADKILRT